MKSKILTNDILRYIAIGLVILPVAILFFGRNGEEIEFERDGEKIEFERNEEEIEFEKNVETCEKLICDIDGAVANPGVYELDYDARIIDLIDAAGGLSDDAYISNINRARKLVDGEKIYIYNESEVAETQLSTDRDSVQVSQGTENTPTNNDNSTGNTNGLININNATKEELERIPGVGPVTADKIIEYRETEGRFSAVSELKNISGIGDKTFKKMEDFVTV